MVLGNIDAAIAWKKEHPEDPLREVADRFKCSKTTLGARISGFQQDHISGSKTALSSDDEHLLIARIKDYASRGTLLAPRHVKAMADQLAGRELGVNWVSRFVKRHCDQITSRFFTFQEAPRLKADVLENRKAFFDLLVQAFNSHHYRENCIYNMDEAPFSLGDSRKSRKIAPINHPKNKQAKAAQSAHITCIATIGVGHAPVPPLIVFKGKNIMENWIADHKDAVPQLAATSETGWSNTHLQLKCVTTEL
ncbi:hypothetical protein IAT40_006411 [Kwoniella sp. CBS 6097]